MSKIDFLEQYFHPSNTPGELALEVSLLVKPVYINDIFLQEKTGGYYPQLCEGLAESALSVSHKPNEEVGRVKQAAKKDCQRDRVSI